MNRVKHRAAHREFCELQVADELEFNAKGATYAHAIPDMYTMTT